MNKQTSKTGLFMLAFLAAAISGLFGEAPPAPDTPPVSIYAEAELGAVKILHHVIQVGQDGTEFNYLTQGGQELLLPFQRLAAGLELGTRNRIQVLYQPLEVVTNVRFREDVTVDGITFAQGSPMQLTYSFPFYRLSWWYDFIADPRLDLSAGISLQLRNASIRFQNLEAAAGTTAAGQLTVSQNLGLVPALNLYAGYRFASGFGLSLDVVGIYAGSAFINGADFDFEGSLLDASLRASYPVKDLGEAFVNLRFLGGTSRGTSQYPDQFWTQSIEKFTMNNLATLALTLGARL
ncbi:hypothetical protein [Spirochaeta lutea]|uniref:Outer membrane protein beta-barrel domain-containing protein n=1 Tax=Spirochaeta lutea TaxID=1480694 RepID=A0A098QZL8_9SPIO|nr:hypothetical protein [Spirochaeta lutea]KGE73300.1 hypothetical protein DC28_04655 [Spirochaeta lutea]